MHERDFDPTTPGTGSGASTAKETAQQATETAKQTAKDVAGTAKEQGRQVAGQVGSQARSVVSDVRSSVAGQARNGNDKLAQGLRRIADDLGGMHGGDTSSPAGQIVSRLGDTGRRAADYIESRGPDGLLDDVQEFARRKPGTFLIAAAAAGFVIGRLGRSTVSAARSDDSGTDYGVAGGSGYETGGYPSTATTGGYATTPTTGLLDDPYAGSPSYGSTPTAVGTASVEPTSYPADPFADPVGVPSERGTAR